jgi:hypothetical protein
VSLKLVHLAARIENSDHFHTARLMLLLRSAAGRSGKPIRGIMKLAKMDFLLRYPNCLVRALDAIGKQSESEHIPDEERNTIEARMMRFRYGPWDKRYRRWIGLLVSKGLAYTYLEGRTINVKLTDAGINMATQLSTLDEFQPLAKRSQIITAAFGGYSATKLKDFVYDVFPEIIDMQWGRHIEL